MASAPDPDGDDVLDNFLSKRGHETDGVGWLQEYNKKQCPECGGLHDQSATRCGVCGWAPE